MNPRDPHWGSNAKTLIDGTIRWGGTHLKAAKGAYWEVKFSQPRVITLIKLYQCYRPYNLGVFDLAYHDAASNSFKTIKSYPNQNSVPWTSLNGRYSGSRRNTDMQYKLPTPIKTQRVRFLSQANGNNQGKSYFRLEQMQVMGCAA